MALSMLSVRRAEPRDAGTVAGLYAAALAEPGGDRLRRRFAGRLAHPGTAPGEGILLAERASLPVGFIAWRMDETLAVLGPLVVRRDLRRCGVGGALVDAAVDALRRMGVRTVEAGCASEHVAASLLASRRFRPIAGPGGDAEVRMERVFGQRSVRRKVKRARPAEERAA